MKALASDENISVLSSTLNVNPGMFVACLYDAEWSIGNITVSQETGDVSVSFRKQDKMGFMWL